MAWRAASTILAALLAAGPVADVLHEASSSPAAFVAVGSFGDDGWTPPMTAETRGGPRLGYVRDATLAVPDLAEASLPMLCPCEVLGIESPPGLLEVWVEWDPRETPPADVWLLDGGTVAAGALPEGAFLRWRTDGDVGLDLGALTGPILVTARHLGIDLTGWAKSPRPNLVAVIPDHLGWIAEDAGPSGCVPDDAFRANARCLRFSTAIANPGPGDLVLSYDGPAEGGAVLQQLGDGQVAAGTAAWHDVHGHVHLQDAVGFQLFAVDDAGRRGDEVLHGGKTGFCLVDWGVLSGSDTPARPRQFWRDDCRELGGLRMGITAGHFDIYRWYLPEQALDVRGLADGTYELVVTVDPEGTLRQSERRDDRASLRFLWQGGQATPLEGRGLYRLAEVQP